MKRYCKNVDITDVQTIYPWVAACIAGKLGRKDFLELMYKYGDTSGIAMEIVKRIKQRDLDLKPILFFERKDGLSGKVRTLGVEEPLQQCMDYVAVNALMPLFEAKIGSGQCASIPHRGQVYGKKKLEYWVNGDFKHSKYYNKADIYHCYQSISPKIIKKHLERDVKNDTLIWFTMELIKTHGDGLSIGSYICQYLCNYLLSYAYHYATEQLYKTRRGKRIRLCYHVLFYMDDVILIGNDKRNLKIAMQKLDKYIQGELGVHFKPKYNVKEVNKEPIDMMGYVIHRHYTTIRGKIFLRARRTMLHGWKVIQSKHFLPLISAYRIISYRGFFVNSNSKSAQELYHIEKLTECAKQTIRFYARKRRAMKDDKL